MTYCQICGRKLSDPDQPYYPHFGPECGVKYVNFIKRYYGQKRSREGGPGSGNWAHRGIPGHVGGSAPKGGGMGVGTGFQAPLPVGLPIKRSVLNGGISDTDLVEFADGSKAVTKLGTFRGSAANEVAVYELDRLLDLGVVPYTDMHAVPGLQGTMQSRQRFVEDADTGWDAVYVRGDVLESEEGFKIGVLDYITGQRDRKGDNWLIKDDKPIAIDNERLPSIVLGVVRPITSSPFIAKHQGRKPTGALRERLASVSKADITRALGDATIDSEFVWDRIQRLQKHGLGVVGS